MDQHAGGEDRQRGEAAHYQRRGGGNQQATEHHDPGPEAIGEDAPGELADGISSEVDGVEVGHGHLVEGEAGVFGDPQFGHGKGFAGEIERGISEPGDHEDLHAPTFETADRVVHSGR
ncbi:hypothetical protein D3C85_1540260 [compost metagenome]